MITEIKINNFKSVADLTLELGRFNILIGSNGSGKSNILEAIAFGAAASADKLDNEFLGSRGIRTASAQLTKSAFNEGSLSKPIQLICKSKNEKIISFNIEEQGKQIHKWIILEKERQFALVKKSTIAVLEDDLSNNVFGNLKPSEKEQFANIINELYDANTVQDKHALVEYVSSIGNMEIVDVLFRRKYYDVFLANFIIYSPEISSLRKFEDENQIKPLGVKGEGLFNVLEIFYENYGEETINEIREYLHIIEWFDDFEAVFDRVSGRKSLVVKDRNMPNVTLNQNNVNEGFLFLLFYISLIISKETPAFFAIDNIEAALHPRLCEELIKNLVKLSKKHNKQIILTTHNPFVLDGLDLNDPEQKLFVVSRNGDGETIADSIKPIKNAKLSDAWMRGRIGGQPETI